MFLEGGHTPNIREGAFGTLMPMLRARAADIALELEPNVSQAVAQGARVVYSLASLYGDFAITGLSITPSFLANNSDAVFQPVCAIQMALDLVKTQRDRALLILHKRFPDISLPVADAALERVSREGIIPSSTVIKQEAWNKAITIRVDIGDLKTAKSMSHYVNNSFSELAKTKCVIP
jgi:NitT/TauT family transport system substrate-binding protein